MALVQVTPEGEGWAVLVDGTQDGTTHDTQDEAERAGRETAKRLNAEFQLHASDGTIREKDSYGNDPRRIEG